jgi:Iap family predicted aminopeptidase
VAKRLRAAGYRVRLQDVPFPIFRERSRPRLEVGGRRIPVRSLSYSPPGRVRAALARAGCGCRSADFDSARGRIALVERGVCTFRVKARLAQAAGARALVVGDRGGESAPSGSLARPGIRIPAVAAGAAGPALRGQALMVVDTVAETRRTRNVIAERPGPPARRVAMLGAHLDSVREGPGINDNGSGVASALALAEQLRDRRGLRFGFWGAEELGLYGSRRYVDSLGGAERRRIAGYINLDMVGSPNPVRYVYGEGPVREALEQALRRRKLAFDEITIGASSDHAPFEDAGISVGGVYSGSDERKSARQARAYGGRAGRPLDACYHRRCDTLDRVDEKVLAELANVAGRALLAIE